jgi:hypothetical protein
MFIVENGWVMIIGGEDHGDRGIVESVDHFMAILGRNGHWRRRSLNKVIVRGGGSLEKVDH